MLFCSSCLELKNLMDFRNLMNLIVNSANETLLFTAVDCLVCLFALCLPSTPLESLYFPERFCYSFHRVLVNVHLPHYLFLLPYVHFFFYFTTQICFFWFVFLKPDVFEERSVYALLSSEASGEEIKQGHASYCLDNANI